MYVRKIDSDWNKHYKDSKLINIPIVNLDYDTLQEWALRIVRDKKLTKKQYYNMALIIRQSLDYAVQKKLIAENPFLKVHVDCKLFQPKKKPVDKSQVFLTDEQPRIEAEAWNDFANTGTVACLAIPFAFQTGLRLGEIVALKESDIDGNYIHVQRMEIRQVEQLENGSDFLFLGENGRVHAKSVDYRIRKYCRHIGISEKALHKIRKTYISTLIDSGLNINEIRKLAGHEDERTTYNNYCFNRMTNEQTEHLLEAALS